MALGKEEREAQWRKALTIDNRILMATPGRPYLDILVERAIDQANKEMGPLLDDRAELIEQARVVREGDHPPYSSEEFQMLLSISERLGMRWKEYVHHVVVTAAKKDLEAIIVIDGGEDT